MLITGVESLGGQGKQVGSGVMRLCTEQGAYLCRRIRLTACKADGSLGATGDVYYAQAGLGAPITVDPIIPVYRPASSASAPGAFLEADPADTTKMIDLFNIWIKPAVAGEGVLWEIQS